jgi:16S rRNA (cytosine967-C5)-methyltransferase
MKTRAMALDILIQVIVHGKSLSHLLAASPRDPTSNSFIQAICYGVCRSFFRLDYILQILLEKPLKDKDQDVYCLLLMGLYQLTEMRVPKHAAVSESVSLTQHLKKEWAKGLVNAVLRNVERRQTELTSEIEKNFSARYSHPKWMIAKFKKDWPKEWVNILNANNVHPPFSLRVNVRHVKREQYIKHADMTELQHTPSGIILKTPVNVSELPGFAAGDVSVQDGAAQLVPDLLMLEKNHYVLDACAAPGGKTAHILETEEVELVAIDKDAKRLQRIEDNLSRLKLSAKCMVADAALVAEWWGGRLFDRILLDAPCSASGVIRRHPDIKILRQEKDIAKLVFEQKRLLQAVWPLLKPNGILVYATCSIFSDENSAIMEEFLQQTADATEEKIDAEWGIACRYGRQILPGMNEMDGFYYSRLRKVS